MYPPFDKWSHSDIDNEPFIIAGREAFNNIFLLAVSSVLHHPKSGKIGYDQFFLSIPSDKLMPGHLEVVKKTFSKFKYYKEPSKYIERGKAAPGQEYIFVTFADNIHKASDDELDFVAWDNQRVEDAKLKYASLLDSALVEYFNELEIGF